MRIHVLRAYISIVYCYLSYLVTKHHSNELPCTKIFVCLAGYLFINFWLYSVQFSHLVMSDSLQPHGLQHTRPPCPSPTPRVYSDSRPLSRWCHPTISSSVVPFSSQLQSFPARKCQGRHCLDTKAGLEPTGDIWAGTPAGIEKILGAVGWEAPWVKRSLRTQLCSPPRIKVR